jgi:hypothetical protein
MKKVLIYILITTLFASCSKVPPNVHYLYTNDCWNTIQQVKAGEVVPKLMTNCSFVMTLPAYEMAGETKFTTMFENSIKANMSITYMYKIDSALVFIQQAKFLTQGNKDLNEYNEQNNQIEQAENTITDKRIIDFMRDITRQTDPFNLDEQQLEKLLTERLNNTNNKGISFGSVSLVTEFDPTITKAIASVQAMRVYKSVDMKNLGEKILTTPTINVNINTEQNESK